ncbi:hypothetical protein M413DRAFT_31073 [Hebeloma cylindrosporum]|uniref:Uncharacterized protein n=1 Tax=Hebeloma cylindrosporum TaxID=76867 RepID=A0A0C2XH02_HEBCY|nr:hypothetical protein M413DRAFT_31073 [Hebeloma cylindrosporum h7]
MQAAHIINTVRKDSQRRRSLKSFLPNSVFAIQPSRYLIWIASLMSLHTVETSDHVQWDVYGTFCIVPTEDDARAMLTALKTSNQKWLVTGNNRTPARPLDVGLAPFDRSKWDVIVLHPQGFLPDGEPIAIAQGRYFQTPTSPPPQSPVKWTY